MRSKLGATWRWRAKVIKYFRDYLCKIPKHAVVLLPKRRRTRHCFQPSPSILLSPSHACAHLSRQLLLLLGIEFNLDRRHESHFLIRCVAAFRCVTVSQLRGIEVGCLPVSHPHMDATYVAAAIHSRHVIYTSDQRPIFFKHGVYVNVHVLGRPIRNPN